MPKILVVDDVLVDRLHAMAILKKAGYEVLEAENGQIGVEMVLAHRPDAVLIDVVMPVMDGFSAARHLRSLAGQGALHIIMMSGRPQESDRARAADLNALILAKPLSAQEVLSALQKNG